LWWWWWWWWWWWLKLAVIEEGDILSCWADNAVMMMDGSSSASNGRA